MEINIHGLEPGVERLRYTPIELRLGDWDTPREYSRFVSLSYLCPASYCGGEIGLREVPSLKAAAELTKSCRAYDGGGYVFAVVRPIQGGKKVKASPWGKPPIKPSGDGLREPVSEPVTVGGNL